MSRSWPGQGGAMMIELLVALVLVVVGVLGLMQVQSRLHESEVESYQRTQALILLNDLASRMGANRNDAASYVTAAPLGVGIICADLPATTVQEEDHIAWCRALQGAAESRSGTDVGAMIGGRGCVQETVGPGVREYMITVTWQGLTPLNAPPAGVACAAGQYNDASTGCVDDRCRRYVTTIVRMADLESI
ncbi:type IV pilus modification protein PilV [Parahaliea aestuarii]|uniref:type IV pilus modification protein PilV n=1 Tax=Parahaliea aestuarii TaxID=1852021 RepID=UPI001C9C0474|nr:type IV pilus modification protein PilV [Parahaliea aestuarii]